MHLVEEKREEAVIAVAGHGDDAQKLVHVLPRADGEGIAGGRLQGEVFVHCVDDIHQFLNLHIVSRMD
jgi:hypothetical protein